MVNSGRMNNIWLVGEGQPRFYAQRVGYYEQMAVTVIGLRRVHRIIADITRFFRAVILRQL